MSYKQAECHKSDQNKALFSIPYVTSGQRFEVINELKVCLPPKRSNPTTARQQIIAVIGFPNQVDPWSVVSVIELVQIIK